MKERTLRILWPAFLVAGVLEMLIFAVFDPQEMRWFGGPLIGWSPLTIYSITFLIFWGAIATAGALTALLTLTAEEINHLDAMSEDSTQAPERVTS